MKWSSVLTTSARLEDSLEEATEALSRSLDGDAPDLLFAFFSDEYVQHAPVLPKALAEAFPGARVVGCSAGGVLAAGTEVENEPGLVLVGAHLPGVKVQAFHIPPPGDAPLDIPVDPEDHPEFVLLCDPFSAAPDQLLERLDERYPESTKIGGLVSGGTQVGESVLLDGETFHRSGTIAVALSGNIEVDTVVAQGCRPIGAPMFVTRADRHVIFELDGQPATDVLDGLHKRLDPSDQELFQTALFAGLVMRTQEVYEHGDFLIRPIIGIDPQARALAIAAEVSEHQVVQLHLRDANASKEDLAELLARHQYASPAGALLFSCLGRGKALYGESHHDSRMFKEQMGSIPLGGFFCSGEIGPVHGKTFVHGYTSSFGLFRPKADPHNEHGRLPTS